MSNESPIQMVDLKGQYNRLKDEVDQGMAGVLLHGRFINGPEVKSFAGELENYLGVNHVIPSGNGTDALQMALMALDLKPGDEVITSSFSFISVLEVVALLGLKPVLVDVDPQTYLINPDQVRAAITSRTRVIIPVHLFGQGADMQELMLTAREYNLFVVEDAAQCIGAEYRMGNSSRKLGTIGDVGCTSFFPSKNLGCFGDGGACLTNDEDLAARIRMIATHGASKKYYSERVGVNSRLDTLQAAVLRAKLPHLDDFNKRRQEAAQVYTQALSGLPFLKLPGNSKHSSHVYNQYTIRVTGNRRDAMRNYLAAEGVPSMIYYPLPLHRQPAFANHFRRDFSLPVSELLVHEVLSLPMHTELNPEQLTHIIDTIKAFLS